MAKVLRENRREKTGERKTGERKQERENRREKTNGVS